MSSYALDNLARNGVINFDADSYIKGTPARFVGDPDGYTGLPTDRPLLAEPMAYAMPGGAHLKPQPIKDGFESEHHKKEKNPVRTMLMIVAGLAALIGLKFGAKRIKAAYEGSKLQTHFKSLKEQITKVTSKIKVPGWLKAVGWGAAGFLGLFAIWKATMSKHKKAEIH